MPLIGSNPFDLEIHGDDFFALSLMFIFYLDPTSRPRQRNPRGMAA